ncbi:radical SAM protein [Lachnospiraceae bacterium MD1]|uniref:Radical SAM protein n=1 Tax=Variimorphobacter saccharofermentans TaxID=2755051 RepID=A0A839K4J0_9FIRM|nr:radical SAM protein [Variimorphobacter saccharofermentans]MBB2183591.1 radical SAM protein [Variimorphobacter saccharofermentans]
MKYTPETCVWELTMECNLHCTHCGSSCKAARPDEITTAEALRVAEEIGAMRLRWVSLMGGELFLRKDWDIILQRLSDVGVNICIITNGTLVDDKIINKMKGTRVTNFSISIDGLRETHNHIRGGNTYEKCEEAFRLAREAGFVTSAITTVMRNNINELPALKEELIRLGVAYWQLQTGLPEGNLLRHKDMIVQPQDIKKIIDFAYETNIEGRILITLPDTIGYYTHKEAIARKIAAHSEATPLWEGCNAGIRSFGILSNGDVIGCTSIRNAKFIEGNIRERSLMDIWEDENSFAWRRNMTARQLQGKCGSCEYAVRCLGGCSNVRLLDTGDIYGENRFCAYHAAMMSEI